MAPSDPCLLVFTSRSSSPTVNRTDLRNQEDIVEITCVTSSVIKDIVASALLSLGSAMKVSHLGSLQSNLQITVGLHLGCSLMRGP